MTTETPATTSKALWWVIGVVGLLALFSFLGSLGSSPTSRRSALPVASPTTATETSPSPTPEESPSPSPSPIPDGCRTSGLANVYHVDRLEVLDACQQVTGKVMSVRHEEDGDYHIDLDVADKKFINDKNISQQHGWLVVEIIPADEAGCTVGQPPRPPDGTRDFGICTGTNLSPPRVGQTIRVFGPFVLDHQHGWLEIHPVWRVDLLSDVPAPAPVVKSSPAPAPATQPADPSNGATAKCNDGTYSYSQHRRGTCSRHGGVAEWYKDVPP